MARAIDTRAFSNAARRIAAHPKAPHRDNRRITASARRQTHLDKPAAGCVAFPLIALEDGFDQRCIEETGIMLIPQRCFVGSAEEDGRERTKTLTGGIRLGYGLADFPAVWARFVEFLARH